MSDDLPISYTVDLVGCARCHGEGHRQLIFERLTYPIQAWDEQLKRVVQVTHWALCPTNDEPILMAFVKKEGGENMDDQTQDQEGGQEPQTESEHMEDPRPDQAGTVGDEPTTDGGEGDASTQADGTPDPAQDGGEGGQGLESGPTETQGGDSTAASDGEE